jgi:hypothetical protein
MPPFTFVLLRGAFQRSMLAPQQSTTFILRLCRRNMLYHDDNFLLREMVYKAMQPQMFLLEIASGKTTPRNDTSL